METADDEFTDAAIDFIERAHKAGKPFFTWVPGWHFARQRRQS